VKRKDTGAFGEALAQEYLARKGYRILETNFRCRAGEIDIVASQRETLVLVEVRCKTNSNFGLPEESITQTKSTHLKAVAAYYLQRHEQYADSWRIDVIAIELGADHILKRINHIKNAIEG
jgi:putative endonuclease